MGINMYLTTSVPNRQFHVMVITVDCTAAHAREAKIKDLNLNKTNVIFKEEDQFMIH